MPSSTESASGLRWGQGGEDGGPGWGLRLDAQVREILVWRIFYIYLRKTNKLDLFYSRFLITINTTK